MSICVKNKNKVSNIFANVNGEKKKIVSGWANKDGIPTKVFEVKDPYAVSPTSAYNNWNYTLGDENDVITLNYYIGSETNVIVYGNYIVNGKTYKTQIASYGENGTKPSKYMFYSKGNIKTIKFSKDINTSNVTNMSGMFYGCGSLTSLDVSGFNTSNVTNMGNMFEWCSSLVSLHVGNFDTSNTAYMNFMFSMCSSLHSLDLINFDTGRIISLHGMFYGCSSLLNLDLTNFTTYNTTNMTSMFGQCTKLEIVYVASGKWVMPSASANKQNMFTGCGVSSVTYI